MRRCFKDKRLRRPEGITQMNKQVPLYEGERLDDLLTNELKIIQSDQVFSFSMDAVLLARFCSVPMKGSIVDLCTGNGVIPLLLSTRTKANIVGVEIQEKLFDMASRTVQWNQLTEQIQMIHRDLKQFHTSAGYGSFDAVTVNPPYLHTPSGEYNINPYISIARHEIECTLEDVVSACSKLVKSGGKVAMVHKPTRLVEIMTMMRQYRLEPKRIRFVHPRVECEANMVLIEALKDGKPEVRLLPPLIVYDQSHQYVDELMHLYYGK